MNRIAKLVAAATLAAGLVGAQPGTASAAPVSVFKTSFSLAQFERLTGVRMTRTIRGRTYYSHFRTRALLRDQGFNFFINRRTGRIVFRSLSNARGPFRFASVFREAGNRGGTNVAFNWSNPRALAISGFRNPVAVSVN